MDQSRHIIIDDCYIVTNHAGDESGSEHFLSTAYVTKNDDKLNILQLKSTKIDTYLLLTLIY